MSDNLLPLLKPCDWEGHDETICTLLWRDAKSQFIPWLTLGLDEPDAFEFLSAETLAPLGLSEEAAYQTAFANLYARTASWELDDRQLDGGKTLKLLVCTDDFYAAERIIDADFLKRAHQRLGAETILVGVPRRGLLLASPKTGDESINDAFSAIVFTEASNGQSAEISPTTFIVDNGKITGCTESVVERLGEQPWQRPADDDADAYVNTVTVKNSEGRLEVHILGGGEDGDLLVNGFETAFRQALAKHKDDPQFARRIRFIVSAYTPKDARDAVGKMVARLRILITDMQSRGMAPIKLSMESQKDSAMQSPSKSVTASTLSARTPREIVKLAFQFIVYAAIIYFVLKMLSGS